jgi:Putative outer membrane beta-barrel porin, MtrB/PioB
MKKILSVLFLFILIFGGRAYAQDQAPADTGQETAVAGMPYAGEAYQFPHIAPTAGIFGGYRFVGLSGSTRADEYDYLHDSVSLGGNLRIFSFPHRLHLDIDFSNKKDYFGDLGYAYKDIVVFRGINRTLYHNLDNIQLIGPAATILPSGAAVAPDGTQGVYVKDANKQYGVRWGMSSVLLRFKTPDYPLHVYFNGSIIDKDGTMQQRFLGGAGSFTSLVRTSQSRDVDWETKNFTVGTNAHLGPVEIEVSHGEKRFDPGGNSVLYDYYTASTHRNEGIFEHNLLPSLKGSSNTVRIHTSYTGRIVASATLTKIDRDNEYSGAKADYFIGAGEVTWTATTNLAVFVKYRHKEADIDNPASVTVTNLSNPADIYTYSVIPSISSITDTASTTVRYRPFSRLTLRAEYDYDHIRRQNAQDWVLSEVYGWHIPEKTSHNTASLSADMRITGNLNLRAGYAHKHVVNPAYNTDPDHSDEGHATISWTPLQRITTFVTYSIAKEERDDLLTLIGNSTVDPKNRDVHRDRVMGAVTYLATENFSVTGSYTYIHDKIRQDIVMGDQLEPSVPDTDLAHSYGLTMNYIPNDRINLSAGVSYTLSSGAFSLTDPSLLQPISVASLSALKTRETDCSLSAEYNFRKGFSAGVRYRYIDFNDVLDNPWDDVQDGRAHIALLTISKQW